MKSKKLRKSSLNFWWGGWVFPPLVQWFFSCAVLPPSVIHRGSGYFSDLTWNVQSPDENNTPTRDAYKSSTHLPKLSHVTPLPVDVRDFVLSLKTNQNIQLNCPANRGGRLISLSLLIFFFKHPFEELFSLNWQSQRVFCVGQEILKPSWCRVEKKKSMVRN